MSRKKIGEVASIYRGVSYKKNQASKIKQNNQIALIRANNISAGRFILNDLLFVPKDLVSEQQIVHRDDIVITMSSGSKSHVGKVAIAKDELQCAFGAFCAKISSFAINPMYLFYILSSNSFRNHIENQCKGTNINNIKQSYILDYEIEVPSINQQEKIVSQIEESLSQLDSAVETLKKTKQQLEVYRQAVLKEEFFNDKTDSLNCLRIVDFADVGTGATPLKSNKDYYNGDIPWITSTKINDKHIFVPTEYITEQAIKETNCRIYPPHTLLVAMYGEGKTRGKCAELMISAATNQALAAIVLREDNIVIKDYLYWFLVYNYGSIRLKSAGGVQPNINLSIVKNILVPVPSIEKQKAIVSAVEANNSICDNIEQIIDQSLQQAEALRQSILKQAFEGK